MSLEQREQTQSLGADTEMPLKEDKGVDEADWISYSMDIGQGLSCNLCILYSVGVNEVRYIHTISINTIINL